MCCVECEEVLPLRSRLQPTPNVAMSTHSVSIFSLHLGLLVFLLFLIGCVEESAYQEPQGREAIVADSLADILRRHFYARDYEGGAIEGEKFLQAHFSSRLQAWHVLNMSRNRQGNRARREALKLSKHLPESAWSWMAVAGVVHFTAPRRGEDSLNALMMSEMALQIAPADKDVQYIHTQVLREQGSPEEALRYIETLKRPLSGKALLGRAQALYASANDYSALKDQIFIDSALVVFGSAREANPTLVDAYYLPANVLNRKNEDKEALALMEQAISVSPRSSSVRQEYGRVVLGQPDMEEQAKHYEVRRVINDALAIRPDSPEYLYVLADLYGDIGDEASRRELEDRLLDIEPIGSRAEWTLLRRIRQFRNDHGEILSAKSDSSIIEEYRALMAGFTNRNWVIREDLLGEVYQKQFFVIDSTVSNSELLDIVQGMDAYAELNPNVTYHHGPRALAERGVYFREAEAIARKGFKAFEEQIEHYGGRTRFESDEAYQKALTASAWRSNDALGWIYLNEGRLTEAEEYLAKAYDLSGGTQLDVLVHLGKLYEKRYDNAVAGPGGDYTSVEEALDSESLYQTAVTYYKEAIAIDVPYEHPGVDALKALYTKRNGAEEGYERFLASLDRDNARQRKRAVLASRIAAPEKIKPFLLNGLDGLPYSNDIIEGKSVAINIWSTTCAPCLLEMPDLQKLHEKYKDDPDVIVLTITRDYNPNDALRWIAEKGYTFPVLVDDGFLNEMDVRAYPLTWFLDGEQFIAYTKTGWSKHLLEEFSWRLEDLR